MLFSVWSEWGLQSKLGMYMYIGTVMYKYKTSVKV